MMRREIKWVVGIIILCICVILNIFFYNIGKNKGKEKIAIDLVVPEDEYEEVPHRYGFLKKEISDYICDLCSEMGLNSDLIVAILMVENPEFDPEAVNHNGNATVDCGLFQLNDRYLWTTFKENYWFDNVELDPFNWKHNTYIAISHIQYLQKNLKVQDDVIMAYNGGINAVMKGTVKQSTYIYLAKVKNNLYLLENKD